MWWRLRRFRSWNPPASSTSEDRRRRSWQPATPVGKNVSVPVDVIVRDDDFADLYVAAQDHVVDKGAPLPIVEPEYIAAMKLVAGRRKDEDDLAFLITSGVIDLGKTERIIRKHLGAYALREFRSFVEEAKWRASRSEE